MTKIYMLKTEGECEGEWYAYIETYRSCNRPSWEITGDYRFAQRFEYREDVFEAKDYLNKLGRIGSGFRVVSRNVK